MWSKSPRVRLFERLAGALHDSRRSSPCRASAPQSSPTSSGARSRRETRLRTASVADRCLEARPEAPRGMSEGSLRASRRRRSGLAQPVQTVPRLTVTRQIGGRSSATSVRAARQPSRSLDEAPHPPRRHARRPGMRYRPVASTTASSTRSSGTSTSRTLALVPGLAARALGPSPARLAARGRRARMACEGGTRRVASS